MGKGNNIIRNFLIGGLLSATTLYIFNNFSEEVSSTLANIPIGTMFYLLTSKHSHKNPIKYLSNNILMVIHNLMLFIMIYGLLYNKVNLYVATFISLIVYIIILLLFYYNKNK